MTGMGRALMGTGYGTGDKRAIEAAQQAISSPLLEDVSINGATGILLNITGGPDLTLAEMNEACSLIAEAADPDANIIFGSVIDANAGDQVRITVIATGFTVARAGAPDAERRPRTRARPRGADGAADAGAARAGARPGRDDGRRGPRPAAAATPRRCRGRAEAAGETINLDDFYLNMEQVPPAALGASRRRRRSSPARSGRRPSGRSSARRARGTSAPLVAPRARPGAVAAPAPTSSASRSRSSTSRPTCAAACSRPSSAPRPRGNRAATATDAPR